MEVWDNVVIQNRYMFLEPLDQILLESVAEKEYWLFKVETSCKYFQHLYHDYTTSKHTAL